MPNRVVIIEGPDGSGKTTMAKYLEQHHGFRYVHNGPPPENEDPLVYYGHMLYEASRAGQPIVFDRAHIGQAVYGPILRDDHRFGYEAVRLCNRITNAYAMSVIIALPPYKAAYTNWKNRKGELFQNDDKFNMVYDRFKDLKDLFAYGHYDYTRDGEKLPQLVDLLVAMQRTDGWLAHGVIGSPTAKFLFVGDAPNQETLDLPFFALNASSEFLNESLANAGFQEREIAITNAYQLGGRTVNEYLRNGHDTRFAKVFALGKRAKAQLDKFGWTSEDIGHPQYWRRFHRHTGMFEAKLKQVRRDFYAAAVH